MYVRDSLKKKKKKNSLHCHSICHNGSTKDDLTFPTLKKLGLDITFSLPTNIMNNIVI